MTLQEAREKVAKDFNYASHRDLIKYPGQIDLEAIAIELYATSQWNAAIEAAQDKTLDLGTQADNLISNAICQQIITELGKLKK